MTWPCTLGTQKASAVLGSSTAVWEACEEGDSASHSGAQAQKGQEAARESPEEAMEML